MIWPSPSPPAWALDAGLPAPGEHETFCEYCERLGLRCADFTVELNERTAELANLRLATYLQRRLPEQFSAYVKMRCRPWRR